MSKKLIGFLLGWFLTFIGLFGLCDCKSEQEKKDFMNGWIIAFIIQIIVILIMYAIYSTLLMNLK